jgi:hypothetical protein
MVQQFRGARYTDLALNAVEIIDRNLYERSCDVRWWATDSAVVGAAENTSADSCVHASSRLATILKSYTVYIDLWIADARGRVIATGRPDRYPKALGLDVSQTDWFRKAMMTGSGEDFAVSDIDTNPALGGAAVATYATAIRADGRNSGRSIGALGIFFDWAPQATAVVKGVGLSPEEWASCRVLLVDARQRVIAASDDTEILSGRFHFTPEAGGRGYFVENGRRLVAHALTPGYETYAGLGWYGVVEYRMDVSQPQKRKELSYSGNNSINTLAM